MFAGPAGPEGVGRVLGPAEPPDVQALPGVARGAAQGLHVKVPLRAGVNQGRETIHADLEAVVNVLVSWRWNNKTY